MCTRDYWPPVHEDRRDGKKISPLFLKPSILDRWGHFSTLIERSKSDLCSTASNSVSVQNHIMGLEGTAGRSYFQCLSGIMPEKYRFDFSWTVVGVLGG